MTEKKPTKAEKADERLSTIAEKVRELIACVDSAPTRGKQVAEELLALLPAE